VPGLAYHGGMPDHTSTLTDPVRRFLAEPHIASVATLDPDGSPRQTVVWYRLDPDGRILLNGRMPRRWCANLARDRRVAISVVAGDDPYRWIGLTGSVEEIDDTRPRAQDDIVALAHRYEPEGPGDDLITAFRSQSRVTFLVRITSIHEHLED
jgi:PPOX class probable F420-dependent enzyme